VFRDHKNFLGSLGREDPQAKKGDARAVVIKKDREGGGSVFMEGPSR